MHPAGTMGGLIPFLLRPNSGDSRGSVIFNPPRPTSPTSPPPSPCSTSSSSPRRPSPCPPAVPIRRQSFSQPTSPTHSPRRSALLNKPLPPTPPQPCDQQEQSKKMFRRFSTLPPGTQLEVPATSAEWKKTATEIKKLHYNKRYRLCSAKCYEILESFKKNTKIEPAYCIYLHFYAASSLEMTARPMPTTSLLRVKLLEQARAHYSSAANLIPEAENSAVAKSRSSSSVSSNHSSWQHSPTDSVSSRAGTPSTDISSPGCRSSAMLGPPASPAAASAPVKKKVSFCIPVPQEPLLRPESPTPNVDDLELVEDSCRELAPPTPPQPSRPSILRSARPAAATSNNHASTYAGRAPSMSSIDSDSAGTITSPATASGSPDVYSNAGPLSSRLSLRSSGYFGSSFYRTLCRFCCHLDGLRSQVVYHVAAVDAELATCVHSMTYDPATARPTSALSCDGHRPRSRSTASSDGMPLENLSERLQRLRANGWKRPRFDPRRYEVLRERVLEELGGAP